MVPLPNSTINNSRQRRFIIWGVGALVLVVIVVGFTRRAAQSSIELDNAEAALRRNDPIAARLNIDRVLARQPKQERGILLAASASRRSDANADAERYLTEFENTSRATEASRLEWALLGAQQGDFGDEEDRLRVAVGRNHPEELTMLEALAKGYMASYRWQDAQEALGRLLAREPDHVLGLVLRAAIAERNRRTTPAEEDLRRAVAKAPDNATAQTAMGGFLSRRGHTREAIYHYQLAQQLQPENAAIRLGLARALADAADMAGAERQLDALLAADPKHADALVERGRLLLRQKKSAEAEPFLERATKAASWHREGHELYLAALKDNGKTEAAAQCASRLAELDREDAKGGKLKLHARDVPGDLYVRMDLWEWSARNGLWEEGVAWLTEVLRAEPKNREAHAAFADHFERVGQPKRAAQHRAAATKK